MSRAPEASLSVEFRPASAGRPTVVLSRLTELKAAMAAVNSAVPAVPAAPIDEPVTPSKLFDSQPAVSTPSDFTLLANRMRRIRLASPGADTVRALLDLDENSAADGPERGAATPVKASNSRPSPRRTPLAEVQTAAPRTSAMSPCRPPATAITIPCFDEVDGGTDSDEAARNGPNSPSTPFSGGGHEEDSAREGALTPARDFEVSPSVSAVSGPIMRAAGCVLSPAGRASEGLAISAENDHDRNVAEVDEDAAGSFPGALSEMGSIQGSSLVSMPSHLAADNVSEGLTIESSLQDVGVAYAAVGPKAVAEGTSVSNGTAHSRVETVLNNPLDEEKDDGPTETEVDAKIKPESASSTSNTSSAFLAEEKEVVLSVDEKLGDDVDVAGTPVQSVLFEAERVTVPVAEEEAGGGLDLVDAPAQSSLPDAVGANEPMAGDKSGEGSALADSSKQSILSQANRAVQREDESFVEGSFDRKDVSAQTPVSDLEAKVKSTTDLSDGCLEKMDSEVVFSGAARAMHEVEKPANIESVLGKIMSDEAGDIAEMLAVQANPTAVLGQAPDGKTKSAKPSVDSDMTDLLAVSSGAATESVVEKPSVKLVSRHLASSSAVSEALESSFHPDPVVAPAAASIPAVESVLSEVIAESEPTQPCGSKTHVPLNENITSSVEADLPEDVTGSDRNDEGNTRSTLLTFEKECTPGGKLISSEAMAEASRTERDRDFSVGSAPSPGIAPIMESVLVGEHDITKHIDLLSGSYNPSSWRERVEAMETLTRIFVERNPKVEGSTDLEKEVIAAVSPYCVDLMVSLGQHLTEFRPSIVSAAYGLLGEFFSCGLVVPEKVDDKLFDQVLQVAAGPSRTSASAAKCVTAMFVSSPETYLPHLRYGSNTSAIRTAVRKAAESSPHDERVTESVKIALKHLQKLQSHILEKQPARNRFGGTEGDDLGQLKNAIGNQTDDLASEKGAELDPARKDAPVGLNLQNECGVRASVGTAELVPPYTISSPVVASPSSSLHPSPSSEAGHRLNVKKISPPSMRKRRVYTEEDLDEARRVALRHSMEEASTIYASEKAEMVEKMSNMELETEKLNSHMATLEEEKKTLQAALGQYEATMSEMVSRDNSNQSASVAYLETERNTLKGELLDGMCQRFRDNLVAQSRMSRQFLCFVF